MSQERRLDFGAGQARNLAARAASGDVLFFLDADVVPERQVIESYARWFSLHDLVVPMGLCRFVELDELGDDELVELVRTGTMADRFTTGDVDDQLWRERHFARTRDLRDEAIDAFRVTIGATLAVHTSLFDDVGGFPELGVRGVEDTAFGYRLHNDGALLVLDRDAQHWHQGRRSVSDPAIRSRINEARAPYVESVMPVKGFRDGEPPRSPPVDVAPVARVRISGDAPSVAATGDSLLGLGTANLALTTSPLAAEFDPAFLQVDMPAGLRWNDATLRRLVDTMIQRNVGVIKALVDGDGAEVVTVARTRALRRAIRVRPDDDPVSTAGELFGTWWATADSLEIWPPNVGADPSVDEPAVVHRAARVPMLARAFDAAVDLLRRAAK